MGFPLAGIAHLGASGRLKCALELNSTPRCGFSQALPSSTDRPIIEASTWTPSFTSELMVVDQLLQPFLNLLQRHNLIPPNAKSTEVPFKTHPKIHILAYIAQNAFGLKLRYKYGLYKHSPHSPKLLTDLHMISNTGNSTNLTLSSWKGLEDFMAFTAAHDDVAWLDIASTLLFVRLSYDILDKNIVKYVCSIKPNTPPQMIRDVYSTLHKLGHL